MYPSWGNFGGSQQSQSYGAGNNSGGGPGFGSAGSLFSSLQEQHLQQMQQLQMLHQKQLQSVLHHGPPAGAYSGPTAGYPGSSWQSADTGFKDSGPGAQSYYSQKPPPPQAMRGQHQDAQSPPPPQPQHKDSQPAPPPPEPLKVNAPKHVEPKEEKQPIPPVPENDKPLSLQDQQQRWYKQHLQNLQKMKQDKGKQNQTDTGSALVKPPIPSSEPPKKAPPPPPPKDEPPTPPPPPPPSESENVEKTSTLTDTPETQDPEEAVRLQQLQAAAAQWQHVQQQRAGLQYQALMQQHEKLQKILEQYQQLIQHTPNLPSLSAEMQLKHYEAQQQKFVPLYQDWERTFILWYDQFQNYPHKDQLQDYENQWKQWQQQMNVTNAHLQERVATLTAMVPYPSTQYSSGMMGQYNPERDPVHPQLVNKDAPKDYASSFTSVEGPRGNNSKFDQMQEGFEEEYDHQEQCFDGPSRVDAPSRFNAPSRFDTPRQPFDGPPRFDGPRQRFDGPPRFDAPRQRFDGPPRFDGPRQRFDGPQRFDTLHQRFAGPPRLDQPRQRFDGPPRFDAPHQRFDGPPRFDAQRQRFDGPPRFDQPLRGTQPQFGQQPRFAQPPRPPSPSTHQPVQQKEKTQCPQSKALPAPKQPMNESKTEGKKDSVPESVIDNDMTDDSMLENGGFFVQKDPIPQTLKHDNSSDNIEKPKPTDSQTPISEHSDMPSKAIAQSPLKDELLKNNQPPQTKTSKLQDSLSSGQPQSKTESSVPSAGRGRGQPPLHGRGRGRGQMEHVEFSGPNNTSLGGDMGENTYYGNPESDLRLPEEQEEEEHWEDPSYEELDDGSEAPNEEMWMPDEHFYPVEEEYYEDPGPQYMGRGGHPLMRGRPPMAMARGGPPMGRGGLPICRGGPPVMRGGPPMGRGGPPMGRGGPPMGRGGPLMGRGGPPMGRGGLPMGRGGPPRGRGGPPMGRGGPPIPRGGQAVPRGGPPWSQGGPPLGRGGSMGRGGHPSGTGESIDSHWEDSELAEYPPEEDQYWEEWAPPSRGMRGMRPPFPPGRGRPPFARGRPPHPPHRPMDHEHYELSTELDPMYHETHGRPIPPEAGRGRGVLPPTPHEIDHGEDWYDEETDRHPPYGRGPPLSQHEVIDRGGLRRQPMGRGIARGTWRQGPVKEYEQDLKGGFVADYGHGENEYHRGSDYPQEDYESQWDREVPPPDRRYPPRIPPAEPYREDPWSEERERVHLYPHNDHERPRVELRVREYREEPHYRQKDPSYSAPSSEWDRPSRLSPLPERHYPDYEHRRPYQDHREGSPSARTSLAVELGSNLPESSLEPTAGTNAGNVLALSQRQHEIILKAAQELKMIRELQESKPEPQPAPVAPDILAELPAGLLGLEIPQDIKNVLKGMAAQTATKEPTSGESNPSITNYQLSLPTPATIVPKTVDYAHGQDLGATVEKISYGERVILRPDPIATERGYEKEPLGLRDPYSRDYYDRRDLYLERREYSRERDYRDKLTERERFERERYLPRDDRSVLSRSGFRERERERDVRERDHSGSRDREHYGRADYDRSPYKQSSLERERFSHGPSPHMERRSYDDRVPPSASALPHAPQPPPRLEKKPEMKNIDDILKMPGRLARPERIVIIMRGLPGSGKSHVSKLIRDKEVHCGGAPPRVIVLDDYFMTEVEKVEKDPDTGRRVKTKVLEYEYEPEMEDTYRSSMLKTFKKTLDDGFFPFIILDTINDKVKNFDQFWSAAKTKGFEVYLAEITADVQTCAKRNVHGRTLKDITKIANNWEASPSHMVCLDVRSILQDAAIEEVEMEDFNPEDELKEPKREEEEESDLGYIPKSKWEMDTSEAKLDKLDGLSISGKRRREGEDESAEEDFFQLPDDYATRMSEPGKKRVRWADLEEQKNADLKRAIGFVVGQTDWERITDDSGQLAQKALNRTKYF